METTPGTEGRLAITPIVVLGMYRSGTSSIAGALEKLGVYFGKHQDFFPVDEFNKTGYRELREIMEFNRAVLAAFGMNSIHARPLQPNWQDLPGNAWITPQLGRILEKHFSGHPVWGWKEPQTCPLMPVYRKALEDIGLSPHYVICVRKACLKTHACPFRPSSQRSQTSILQNPTGKRRRKLFSPNSAIAARRLKP